MADESDSSREVHPELSPVIIVEVSGYVGSEVVLMEGMDKVVAVSSLSGEILSVPIKTRTDSDRIVVETVHNFEVEGVHNYRVGLTGILVHNTGCKIEYHHFFPIQFWPRLRGFGFETKILNNTGKMLPRDLHKRVHGKGYGLKGAWNDKWETYFMRHKAAGTTPSKNDLWDFMESLKREFGLNYGG